MPLFEKVHIKPEEVGSIVEEHWGILLGPCLKTSQNTTYEAAMGEGESAKKFIVRITPDPHDNRLESIKLELKFLDFLKEHNLPVCPGIPSKKTGALFVRENALIISVFQYSHGEVVLFGQFKWMTEKEKVLGLGRWLAKFHDLSRQFSRENPELVKSAREWSELHEGVLAGVPVSEEDEKTRTDPEIYGLIHGDTNPSNYFWLQDLGLPHMFDWDQLQSCWFLYDLTSSVFAVEMLAGAGLPYEGKPVPEANVAFYTEGIIEGYEEIAKTKVDRQALQRMMNIRRELYRRFCSRAEAELEPDSEMGKFCDFINKWLVNVPL